MGISQLQAMQVHRTAAGVPREEHRSAHPNEVFQLHQLVTMATTAAFVRAFEPGLPPSTKLFVPNLYAVVVRGGAEAHGRPILPRYETNGEAQDRPEGEGPRRGCVEMCVIVAAAVRRDMFTHRLASHGLEINRKGYIREFIVHLAEGEAALESEAAEVGHADARELVGVHAALEPAFDVVHHNIDTSVAVAASAADLREDDPERLARGDGGACLCE